MVDMKMERKREKRGSWLEGVISSLANFPYMHSCISVFFFGIIQRFISNRSFYKEVAWPVEFCSLD